MGILYQHWLGLAHSAIEAGYDTAILHYSLYKEQFLQELEKVSGQQVDNFIQQINNQVGSEIPQELDETFDSAFNAIKGLLETQLAGIIEGKRPEYLQLQNKFKNMIKKGEQGKVNPDNLYKNLLKDIELFLSKNNITKSGLSKYVAQKTGLNTNNADIANNLFGYARKLILAQLQGNDFNYPITHYKKSLKGYYKEELLVPAFNKVLSSYQIESIHTASLSDKGVQIKYDLVLGPVGSSKLGDDILMGMIKQMESFSQTREGNSSILFEENGLFGGVQSKSWVAPWSIRSKGGNRKFLDFGNNASLMPTGEDAHYWHAGVYNVMNNLVDAVGINNFMFATGDTVYWTADLLTEFREQQYVLAFYYNTKKDKIISSTIGAQLHYC